MSYFLQCYLIDDMRGEDGKFIPRPDSLHPKPACIKLPKEIREWIKSKGTEFHRKLVVDAWKAEGHSAAEISLSPDLQTLATLSAIACPRCTCEQFKVFINRQQDNEPQLQCTFCNHVFLP